MRANKAKQAATDGVRLDKWLWAARFYKTRALATEAINGGHVQLNGTRVKPSRTLRVADRLLIRKAGVSFDIEVLALSDKRGPAKVAELLYHESEASVQARAEHAEQHRLAVAEAPHPARRPDKRARRHIIRFTEKNR